MDCLQPQAEAFEQRQRQRQTAEATASCPRASDGHPPTANRLSHDPLLMLILSHLRTQVHRVVILMTMMTLVMLLLSLLTMMTAVLKPQLLQLQLLEPRAVLLTEMVKQYAQEAEAA